MPSGSQPWAGLANEDVSAYPFTFGDGLLHLLVQQMVNQQLFTLDLKRILILILSLVTIQN